MENLLVKNLIWRNLRSLTQWFNNYGYKNRKALILLSCSHSGVIERQEQHLHKYRQQVTGRKRWKNPNLNLTFSKYRAECIESTRNWICADIFTPSQITASSGDTLSRCPMVSRYHTVRQTATELAKCTLVLYICLPAKWLATAQLRKQKSRASWTKGVW